MNYEITTLVIPHRPGDKCLDSVSQLNCPADSRGDQ